ncbi:MAG: SpaA isopeptide-forming pilin-related protein [Oscillospiraceae bacterium]|jgi:fimbrial isopeptide formation D2 family protein/LPXTG-motif cell wall-anchored protein/uncharacterized repeat protein (TIGR02543 family)
MKKFTSKLVALLIVVLMVCALLPVSALAITSSSTSAFVREDGSDVWFGWYGNNDYHPLKKGYVYDHFEDHRCTVDLSEGAFTDVATPLIIAAYDSSATPTPAKTYYNPTHTEYVKGSDGEWHAAADSLIDVNVTSNGGQLTTVLSSLEAFEERLVEVAVTFSGDFGAGSIYGPQKVTGNLYYQYVVTNESSTPTPATYTVTYTDGVAEEVIFEDQVYSNQTSGTATPAFEGTPTREGYTFKGWSPELAATVTESVTYVATWEKNTTPVDPDPGEKTNEPGMEKTADKTSAGSGETVHFTLTSNVPDYLGDYLNPDPVEDPSLRAAVRGSYELTFHDKMDSVFAFNDDTTVTVNGKALDSSLYTVTKDTGDDCAFHVTMDLVAIYEAGGYFTLEEIENSPEIVVTYSGTLSENAGAGTYTNQAWAGFEGKESEKPIVNVDVYGVDIFKYDQKTDEGLAGAEFELKDSEGTVIATLTSNEDGHAHYEGLAAGTYTIVETKAPDGYVKSDKPLTVVIPDNADATTNIADVQFANSEIPHTGGTGTMAYTIGGLAIIGIAAVGFVISRKKKTQAE